MESCESGLITTLGNPVVKMTLYASIICIEPKSIRKKKNLFLKKLLVLYRSHQKREKMIFYKIFFLMY